MQMKYILCSFSLVLCTHYTLPSDEKLTNEKFFKIFRLDSEDFVYNTTKKEPAKKEFIENMTFYDKALNPYAVKNVMVEMTTEGKMSASMTVYKKSNDTAPDKEIENYITKYVDFYIGNSFKSIIQDKTKKPLYVFNPEKKEIHPKDMAFIKKAIDAKWSLGGYGKPGTRMYFTIQDTNGCPHLSEEEKKQLKKYKNICS